MKVELISVGTELLLGDILNSNSQYLSKKMAELGFSLYYQTVVGDNEERLLKSLEIAYERADLVITTGGLGPTDDDMTKEVCAKFFGEELVEDKDAVDALIKFFAKRKIPMPERNKKQALYIKGSQVLKNNNGTAPGLYFHKNDKHLIILPGPPSEMKPMFENEAFPILQGFQEKIFVSEYLNVFGIGESTVNDILSDLIAKENPSVAPYAKSGFVTLRVTAAENTAYEAKAKIGPVKDEIYKRLDENIFSEGDLKLEEVVKKLLNQKKFTLSVAESCSGGLLTAKLVSMPGISSILLEGDVVYSNKAKMNSLGVSEDALLKYGAVSKEVALEMAEKVALKNNSNVGISTTGIAGPHSDDTHKPVGLVYLGLYINGKTSFKELNLVGSRQKIREMTVLYALDYIRRELKNL